MSSESSSSHSDSTISSSVEKVENQNGAMSNANSAEGKVSNRSNSNSNSNQRNSSSNGHSTGNDTEQDGESLPYADAGLPARRMSSGSSATSRRDGSAKKKTRIKLLKLKQKRDSKYMQILDEEEGTVSTRRTPNSSASSSPVVREYEALTNDGNSLPNLAPARQKEKWFVKIKRIRCCKVKEEEADGECCARICCYSLIALFLALIIAGLSSSAPAKVKLVPPSRPPSIIHDGDFDPSGHGNYTIHQWNILKQIDNFVSAEDLSTPNTPHHKAMHWLLWIDEMGYQPESPYLAQRFVLALFHYKMSSGNGCFQLEESLDECEWERIDCDGNGYVQKIWFENCNLSGPIPPEVREFKKIQVLDLSRNDLTGVIPSELEMLSGLESIYLEKNKLQGQMPAYLCRSKQQNKILDLTVQCTGDSSNVVCQCCDTCDGTPHDKFPIGGGTSDFLDNKQKSVLNKLKTISGTKVTEVDSPQYKAAHWIMKEDEGMYPAESQFLYQRYVLALLHYMVDIQNMVVQLDGSKDECEWQRVTCNGQGHIESIKFDHSGMSGNMPTELKVLHDLKYLDLSSNKLSGQIPSALSLLSKLETLLLNDNDIVGVVPSQLCERHDTGELQKIETDCNGGTKSKVKCSCCTECSASFDKPALDKPVDNGVFLVNDDNAEIISSLNDLSGNKMYDTSTPQYHATNWILTEDKLLKNYETSQRQFLYQRYILVLLYYKMGRGNNEFTPDPFNSECKWEKVNCNAQGYVTSIHFDNCDLSGSIPVELKVMDHLKHLDFTSNHLSGNIPSELSFIMSLETLSLEDNDFVGIVPQLLCELHNAGSLLKISTDCGDNVINKVICSCCNCNLDNSGSYEWTESQKSIWNSLKSISGVTLSDPNSPQYLAAHWIIEVDAYRTDRKFIYQRYVLVVLHYMMSDNSWFYPSAIMGECQWDGIGCNDQGYITHMKLDDCGISGSIPPEIQLLHDLNYLDFSSNKLSGEVPTELAQLVNLETLLLDDNLIQGSVPLEVCQRHDKGNLAQIATDCKGGINSKVQCSCCFNCPSLTNTESGTVCSAGNLNSSSSAKARRESKIKSKCIELSGDIVCEHNSPQDLAMRWLIDDDKLLLNADSSDFVQRYVVAVIYFSLGPASWVDSFWLTPTRDECNIPGIVCDSQMRITALKFSDDDMEGLLPSEVSHLQELRDIDFSDNEIDGNIPKSWQSLKNLKSLVLDYNEMSGSVPQEICSLRSNGQLELLKVDCDDLLCDCCYGCSGSIGNNPDGRPIVYLPPELRAIEIRQKLNQVSFKQNDVDKSIQNKAADWIVNVDKLQLDSDSKELIQRYVLSVIYYSLDGDNWDVQDNNLGESDRWLTGKPYCSWIGITCDAKDNVMALDLPFFNLRGDLPYETGSLQSLRVLNMSNNKLTGSLPDELSNLSNLSILSVYNNQMSGMLLDNEGVCFLVKEKTLRDLWVDCDDNNPHLLSCQSDCCTKCGKLGLPPS